MIPIIILQAVEIEEKKVSEKVSEKIIAGERKSEKQNAFEINPAEKYHKQERRIFL